MARAVLVVDDQPAFRRAARRLREPDGLRALGEAPDGGEAVVSLPRRAT